MTGELQYILTITLIFLAVIFYISTIPRNEPKNEPPKKKKSKTNSDDIVDALDWMLAHSIITPQEYTKIMGKCLPFL